MKRLKLKKGLKNKFLFENGLEIGLSNEIVNEYDLKRREELSHSEYLKVLELAALSTAYFYLAKRDYGEKEIYIKLLQKYKEKYSVLKAVEILKEKNYLDDFSYALSYITNKSVGKKKLEFNLRSKGISSDVIEKVFQHYDSEEELENLKRLWRKLEGKDIDKKIMSLMRKGYSYSDIKKVKELCQEEE